MEKIIEVTNLSLELNNTKILKDINFAVKRGEIHCIVGPNGGGKSSFFKSLLGLHPHEGEIALWLGENKTIGYIPQSLNFDRSLPLTVADFLAILLQKRPGFLGKRKKTKELIKELLTEVKMQNKSKRLIGELSGGELQRVLLAQGLYPKPALLLLDEPFTGLDQNAKDYFREEILKLKDKGMTILWINHDLKEVKELADKVTCIKKEVIFSGKPKELLTEETILKVFS